VVTGEVAATKRGSVFHSDVKEIGQCRVRGREQALDVRGVTMMTA